MRNMREQSGDSVGWWILVESIWSRGQKAKRTNERCNTAKNVPGSFKNPPDSRKIHRRFLLHVDAYHIESQILHGFRRQYVNDPE